MPLITHLPSKMPQGFWIRKELLQRLRITLEANGYRETSVGGGHFYVISNIGFRCMVCKQKDIYWNNKSFKMWNSQMQTW